jgi:hypothetical protein
MFSNNEKEFFIELEIHESCKYNGPSETETLNKHIGCKIIAKFKGGPFNTREEALSKLEIVIELANKHLEGIQWKNSVKN